MISSNMFLSNKQIPIYFGEKNYSPVLPSPPPSPPFQISDALAISQPSSPSTSYEPLNTSSLKQSRYRMRLSDAPSELLEYIEISKSILSPTKSLSSDLIRFSLKSYKSSTYEQNNNLFNTAMNISTEDTSNQKLVSGRHRNVRKNPYPIRSPSITSPNLTDPMNILRGNNSDNDDFEFKLSLISDNSSVSSPSESQLSCASSPSTPPSIDDLRDSIHESTTIPICRSYQKKQQRTKQVVSKRLGASSPHRKRKGNSLARVMADRGLLESVFNSNITSNDIKSVRIPPPPPMQFDELITNIKALDLDTKVLDTIDSAITWKGQPLSISHLPHYDSLHPAEAQVVSVLRLTPVQYLTGKHTLISAAQRYNQRNLPFKKSDAQKLLRIDVNKASKLWEFFRQVRWI
ncbi:10922_t:CDS:1 [Diversispora eburnea]|uniref:10922_t:CDS:1 n=1 Tax=Diversispora eburnea TaxID=1213867 RepID=A0A9N8YMF4_9GLOM|nr:10922_t:CDS:1 [Diversispora eburnea]